MNKKISIVAITLLLLFSASKQPNDHDLWRQDFENLKYEMVNGYANLSYTVQREGIDLHKLSLATLERLDTCWSVPEAQQVIFDFLKTFSDGHLRARVINDRNVESGSSVENSNPTSMDSVEVALRKMDFSNKLRKLSIRYDSLPGYHALIDDGNPFEAAVVKTEKGKIGMLRIKSFLYERYWDVASVMWNSYRSEFEEECNSGCQWTFKKNLEKELTQLIIQRIEALNTQKIDALVVDVSANGGGYEWFEQVARLLSDKQPLIGSDTYVIRHEHWRKQIQRHIAWVEKDLNNDELSTGLKSKLADLKSLAEELLVATESDCEPNMVWNKNNLACLELIKLSYSTRLPFDIMEDPQFDQLNSKYIIGTHWYIPFRRGVYAGPLYVVQDKRSGSATEGFASLLQINDVAKIVGEYSYGAGCGYTNGGLQVVLPNIGLKVSLPDCVRLRKDGENEINGIKPDIQLVWKDVDSPSKRAEMVIDSVLKDYFN